MAQPVSSSGWKEVSARVKMPSNAAYMTVLHLIQKVGWLATDEFSLELVSDPTPTLTPTPTNSPTATNTPSSAPTNTPTPTLTSTPTSTPSPTGTPIPNTPTPTNSPTPTNTPTPTFTPTPTIEPTATPSPIQTPTGTPIPTLPPLPSPIPPPIGPNLILNQSLEDSANGIDPDNWARGNWGSNTAVFSYPVAGYQSAKAGRVEISQYQDGDAKWYFQDVAVEPGSVYNFSDYYQSNTFSHLIVRYSDSGGNYSYVYLAQLDPAADWAAGLVSFTIPVNAVSMTMFHLINQVGYLTVDNFSLTKAPVEPGFARGMVSFDFDDGWLSVYNNAIPILSSAGFKSTQYIISGEVNQSSEYMNSTQLLALKSAGHEIGSHTKTHPDLGIMVNIGC